MGHYRATLTQTVTFAGPTPVNTFDLPRQCFGGFSQTTYRRDNTEQRIFEGELQRKVLEFAANKVLEFAKSHQRGDCDLGPLGMLKGVDQILSVSFNRDLVIEYVVEINGEHEL